VKRQKSIYPHPLMKRLSLRVVEGLARRRHGNRLKRDFNAQVPIPARTGNGFGEDEKSVRPLFSSRWEGVFYCPGKWRGRGAPRLSRKVPDAQQRIPANR